jgi:hypothetical protein
MHPLSTEAPFTVLLNVNTSVLSSVVLVDALVEAMGVDITLELLLCNTPCYGSPN